MAKTSGGYWTTLYCRALYDVSKKRCCWILAATFLKVNRFSKFCHCRMENEISNKTFLPHLKYIATLPGEMHYRPLRARTHQIEILSKLSFWLHHVVHNKIYHWKIHELKIARFIPYFERWNLHQIVSALSFGARRHCLVLTRLELQWLH